MAYRPFGGPVPNPGPRADVGSTIREAVQDFCTNFNTANYDQCANLLAHDAYFMAPNHEMVQGKQAIERALQTFADQGYQDLRLETILVDSSGDMAVEIGRYVVSIRQPNGTNVVDRGKYLTAWRRFGVWLKIADCWSSDLPLGTSNEAQAEPLPNSKNVGMIAPGIPRSA